METRVSHYDNINNGFVWGGVRKVNGCYTFYSTEVGHKHDV